MADHAERVHQAIADAVADANPGHIVTAYVIVIETTDGSDETAFVHDAAAGQAVAHTIGLLDVGQHYHRGRIGDARGA